MTGHDGPVLIASHDRDFLDRVATSVVELDLAQRRIGTTPAATVRLRRRPGTERRRKAQRGVRGVRRDAGPPRLPGSPACRVGREGPAQRRAQRRARQEHPREAQGARRPPGGQGGARAAGRRPARRRGPAAQGVGAALRDRPGPGVRGGGLDARPRRGPSVATSSSVRSTSPSPAATGCCSPATTGPARPRCWPRCSVQLPLTAGRVSLGSRVRLGVIDQDRSLARTRRRAWSSWCEPSSVTPTSRRSGRCWPSSGSAPSTSTGPPAACRWASAPGR